MVRAPNAVAGRIALWAVIAGLLLSPLVAMQFTDEVAWTAGDFLFAAVVLCGAGAIYEIAAPRMAHRRARLVLGAAIVCTVLIIWAEGAVGILD